MADGYNRQVRGNTVVLKPQRQTSSLAGAIGGVLEQAGGTLGKVAAVGRQADDQVAEDQFQIQQLEKRRAQAAAMAVKAGQIAEAQTALEASERDLPEYSAPGAVGYAAKRGQQVDDAFDKVLADVTDPEVRNQLLPVVARARAGYKTRAQDYEDQTFRSFQGEEVKKWGYAQRNALARDPNGENLNAALIEGDKLLDALRMDGARGPKAKADLRAELTAGYIDGQLDRGNHKAVKAMIGSGELDSVFDPQTLKTYDGMADNAARAEAKAAELAQAEAQDKATEGLKLLEEREGGNNPPAPSEWAAALQAAGAAGVEGSTIEKYRNKAVTGTTARQIGSLSAPVLESQAEQLRAKVNSGAASPAERGELELYESETKKRGGTIGAQVAPMLKGGPEQRMQGFATLAALPPNLRWRAAEAAGDPKAALIAGLGPEARGRVAQGQLVRTNNKDAVLPPLRTGKTRRDQEAEVDRAMSAFLGPELMRANAPYRQHLREGALDYVAGFQDNWNAGSFEKGLRVMFGGTQRGNGSWQGGIGTVYGRKIELPDQWNESEFEQRLARYGFEGATYADGSPAKAADVRANYQLEYAGQNAAGDALYNVIDARGRALLNREPGRAVRPYVMAVPANPRGR